MTDPVTEEPAVPEDSALLEAATTEMPAVPEEPLKEPLAEIPAPSEPVDPVPDPGIEVICPGCGTQAWVDLAKRSADEFCVRCDYPLFWALGRREIPGGENAGDTGLRRLPGTAGRAALASLACPQCTEPNPPAATLCSRCGADLHPEPVMVEPEPEPLWEPEPEPEPVAEMVRPGWVWLVVGAVLLVTIIVILVISG